MPQPGASDSGLRFASDLRRIRESKGMTLDFLHNETKIPKNLLQSFEGTGLFDHPMFNRVYLRSFVRNYADVLGINADVALQSLDEALDGRYHGRLAVEYLGEKPEITEAPPVEAATSSGLPAGMATSTGSIHSPTERTSEGTIRKPGQPVKRSIHYSEPAVVPPVVTPVPPEIPVRESSSEWTSQSPPPTSRASYAYEDPSARSYTPWIVAGVVIVVLIVAAWFLFRPSAEPDAEVAASETETVQSDTTSNQTLTEDTEPAVVSLPDTLRLTIQAANDKVEKIQVTVDEDLRRPYWIERGESRSFVFRNRIVLERQLSKINLVVNGNNYPVVSTDSLGRLVITRDSVMRHSR